MARDTSILKLFQDGVLLGCCSPGAKLVWVQLELDYSNLAIKCEGARQNPILHGEYYLQLLQGSVDLTKKHGVHYRLTTFLGAANLQRITPLKVQSNILNSTHQDGPCDLLAPSFNFTLCQKDSTAIYRELKSMAMYLALDTIHNTLFMVLVLGYTIELHYVYDHIWQSYVDAEGKMVQLSAQVYYSTFINAIDPFMILRSICLILLAFFKTTYYKSGHN